MTHITKKKLLLHFDINGTVIAGDSVDDDMSLDQKASELLTKHIFGKITMVNGRPVWKPSRKFLNDQPGTISFNKFARAHLNYYGGFMRYCYMFKDSHVGNKFKVIHSMIKAILKKNRIFQSFKNLIHYLRREGYDYHIVFRTFGHDADHVIRELNAEHLLHAVESDGKKKVHIKKLVMKDFMDYDDLSDSYKRFAQTISDHDTNYFVCDNYDFWNSHDKKPEFGKQIICADSSVINIGFDDNPCMMPIDTHGNVILKNKKYVFKISPIIAMNDENYYISLFRSLGL